MTQKPAGWPFFCKNTQTAAKPRDSLLGEWNKERNYTYRVSSSPRWPSFTIIRFNLTNRNVSCLASSVAERHPPLPAFPTPAPPPYAADQPSLPPSRPNFRDRVCKNAKQAFRAPSPDAEGYKMMTYRGLNQSPSVISAMAPFCPGSAQLHLAKSLFCTHRRGPTLVNVSPIFSPPPPPLRSMQSGH